MTKNELFKQVKVRDCVEKNYHAVWYDLNTLRFGEGANKELEPDRAEFYDVCITTMCNADCPFCYAKAARGKGMHYSKICDTWKKWMDLFPKDEKIEGTTAIRTHKPLQIAVGSAGEPTIHPEFVNFLETVFNTGVVPNYTTNGLAFSRETGETVQRLLVATQRFCGGVAVSFGNVELRDKARKAVMLLMGLDDVKVNIHHIISGKESVDSFLAEQDRYGDRIYYHVLLPLVDAGGNTCLEAGTWEYLEEKLSGDRLVNVSFGAKFEDCLKGSKAIKTWMYPSESLSKNVLLQKDRVVITPSSFDLTPIKIIDL